MANFTEAYELTSNYERGYSFNPKDAGRETFKGISRRYHSYWHGWHTVDLGKSHKDFPKNIEKDKYLSKSVKEFYKATFWIPIKGDIIAHQGIANLYYDIAVNGSVERATRFLQETLNLLNRQQKDYSDLIVDGSFGFKSYEALEDYLSKRDPYNLMLLFGSLMLGHWTERARSREDQEEFMNGIVSRWRENIRQVVMKHYNIT